MKALARAVASVLSSIAFVLGALSAAFLLPAIALRGWADPEDDE